MNHDLPIKIKNNADEAAERNLRDTRTVTAYLRGKNQEMQLARITEFCNAHQITVKETVREKPVKELLDLARDSNAIVCLEPSRLSRDMEELASIDMPVICVNDHTVN